jgi:hypothetical protein
MKRQRRESLRLRGSGVFQDQLESPGSDGAAPYQDVPGYDHAVPRDEESSEKGSFLIAIPPRPSRTAPLEHWDLDNPKR